MTLDAGGGDTWGDLIKETLKTEDDFDIFDNEPEKRPKSYQHIMTPKESKNDTIENTDQVSVIQTTLSNVLNK